MCTRDKATCVHNDRALSVLSHVQLIETQWTVACWASLSTGFSRQEYWSGLVPPGDLPHQGSNPHLLRFLHLQLGSLPLSHLEQPREYTHFHRYWTCIDIELVFSGVTHLNWTELEAFETRWTMRHIDRLQFISGAQVATPRASLSPKKWEKDQAVLKLPATPRLLLFCFVACGPQPSRAAVSFTLCIDSWLDIVFLWGERDWRVLWTFEQPLEGKIDAGC